METHRPRILEKLKKGTIFDLLVIGGGATDCSVALDVASRGLSSGSFPVREVKKYFPELKLMP